MRSSLSAKFFPPPSYLVIPAVGLDISDQSIKWLRLTSNGAQLSVASWGEKAVPAGLLEAGRIRNKEELVRILSQVQQEGKITYVNASLPEEQTYLIRLKLPPMDASELRQSIELQLEEHVPLPAADTVFDFEVVSAPTKAQNYFEVAVSVMARPMLSEYLEVLTAAGITVKGLEIEGQSLSRALVPAADQGTVMIVDIGKVRSGLSIISKGVVLYTASIGNIGGEDITRNIQKNLGITYEEAEQTKFKKGIANMTGDKELFSAMVPVLSTLKDEINKVYAYWQQHQNEDGFSRPAIESILLSGGQSSLVGLVDYMRGNLPIPVAVGNPWVNVLPKDAVPPLEYHQSMRYATTIGLALRNFNHD